MSYKTFEEMFLALVDYIEFINKNSNRFIENMVIVHTTKTDNKYDFSISNVLPCMETDAQALAGNLSITRYGDTKAVNMIYTRENSLLELVNSRKAEFKIALDEIN